MKITREIYIVGSGGHGRVILDVLRATGVEAHTLRFVDDRSTLWGTDVDGVRVGQQLEDRPAATDLNIVGMGAQAKDRSDFFEGCLQHVVLPDTNVSSLGSMSFAYRPPICRLSTGSTALDRKSVV